MARKPEKEASDPGKLPPIFGQFEEGEGGSAIARLEVYRLQPNGRASIGEAPLDASSDADLIQYVRDNDHSHGRTGGVYLCLGKKENGDYIKGASHRFRVDRDPTYVAPNTAGSTAPAGDSSLVGMTSLVSILEAQSRSYEARVKADMNAREQQARLDAERRERDQQAQLNRERAYYDQQRERDRELSDQARERDRAMYGFLIEARTPNANGNEAVQSLLLGLSLAQELGGGDAPRGSFGDKLLDRLGRKFLGGGETPRAKSPRTAKANGKTPPASANGSAVDDEEQDEPSEEERFAEMLETLLLNVDVSTASQVLISMIRGGKLRREIVGELAAGTLDAGLDYDADTLDKLHKAADTAHRATAPAAAPTP